MECCVTVFNQTGPTPQAEDWLPFVQLPAGSDCRSDFCVLLPVLAAALVIIRTASGAMDLEFPMTSISSYYLSFGSSSTNLQQAINNSGT